MTKSTACLPLQGARITSADVAEKVVKIELAPVQNCEINEAYYDVESIQNHIEQKTGYVTVVKGLGDTASAVAELRPSNSKLVDDVGAETSNECHGSVCGVIRLTQLEGKQCFVNGLLDGLEAEKNYTLNIHRYGDLSGDTYENIGPVQTHLTDLKANSHNSYSISKIIPDCHVPSMIGQSVAISSLEPSDFSARIVRAAVIARASTIQANKKKVCACSGKTLWQERLDKRMND